MNILEAAVLTVIGSYLDEAERWVIAIVLTVLSLAVMFDAVYFGTFRRVGEAFLKMPQRD
ncbi:hypothetical protein D3C84_1309520 [compost metagenome]